MKIIMIRKVRGTFCLNFIEAPSNNPNQTAAAEPFRPHLLLRFHATATPKRSQSVIPHKLFSMA
jgi:hypothetical protein